MLNIKSLEYRRLEFDLFFTYKIIHGIVDINFSDFFLFGQCGYDLRRHSFAIKPLTKPSTDHLLHFFSHRVPQVWNKLPESVVFALTFTAFFFDCDMCVSLHLTCLPYLYHVFVCV